MIPPSAKVPIAQGQPFLMSEEWVRYLTVTLPGALGLTVYEVAHLPSEAGAAFTRAFVSDANAPTFGALVVGGGAEGVPVFCDGITWRVG